MIIRIDDNGNNFLVSEYLNESECDELLSKFIGHKQYYFKVEYSNRNETLKKYIII